MAKIELEVSDELKTQEVIDFAETAKECIDLYSKKNHDYGNSFDKGMNAIGPAYGVGRIYDKVNRLITLSKNTETAIAVTDESIEDTVKDLACYSIMTLCYIKRLRKESLKDIDLS